MNHQNVQLLRVAKVSRSKCFVLVMSCFTGLYAFAWSTKWTFNPFAVGAVLPGRFFTAQAEAMLQGQLWVEPQDLPAECIFRDGKCFGYFGIFPSIVRLPFILLFGSSIPESTAFFVSLAAGIAVWAAVDLCRRIVGHVCPEFSAPSAIFMIASSLALGPGSVLILLSDPYVYQEAIVWSIAATLVGGNLMWRWWNERHRWQMIAAILAFTCAAGARVTMAGIGLVTTFGILMLAKGSARVTRKMILALSLLCLTPLVASFGVLYIKFDAFTQPINSYEQASSPTWKPIIEKNGGVLVRADFLPTALIAYLRPDALRFSTDYPWISFRFGSGTDSSLEEISYVPSSRRGSMYVERNTSITNVMPLALASTVAAGYSLIRRKRLSIEAVLLVALCTPALATAVNVGVTARYLGDIYPLVATGMAFSGSLIPQFGKLKKHGRVIIAGTVLVLTVFSLVALPVLAMEYSWIYRYGIQ